MTSERDQYHEGEDVTARAVIARSPGMVVSVRLEGDEAKRLRTYARRKQRTVSDVARQAIHNFLEAEAYPTATLIATYSDEHFSYGMHVPVKTYGTLTA